MYHVAFRPLPSSGITREALLKANVVRLVRDFVGTIPGRNEGQYQIPSEAVSRGMVDCARQLMHGIAPAQVSPRAEPFGYEAISFYDHVMDRMLSILRPRAGGVANQPPHWGLYIFSQDAVSNVVVQAPHPRADLYSDLMAAQAFQGGDARALFVAGAHRYAVPAKPGEPDIADVARFPLTVFNDIHGEALKVLKPSAVVQFHGYGDKKTGEENEEGGGEGEEDEPRFSPPDSEESVNVIVSAGLTVDEASTHRSAVLLEEAVKEELRKETQYAKLEPTPGPATELKPNVKRVESLMGASNEQRKTIREAALEIPFLHLEVHRSIRGPESWNQRATSRLALAAIDALHRHLGIGRPPLKDLPMTGFDRNEYPGRTPLDGSINEMDGVMATWIHHSPLGFAGYYLDSTRFLEKRIVAAQRWAGRRRRLTMLGWELKPLYYGNEYDVKMSNDLSAEEGGQGGTHAAEAVELARQEGFNDGTVIYLDVENTYGMEGSQSNLRRYVHEWLTTFAALKSGYLPGVYCSPASARQIQPEAPPGTVFWVHNVDCRAGSPGCRILFDPPPVGGSGISYATVWQYAKSPIHGSGEDFGGCFEKDSEGRVANKRLGEGYTGEAPVGDNPADPKPVKPEIGACWTPLMGVHVQWTAEVDLDVAASPPLVIELLTPIWLEIRRPSSDHHVLFRIRVRGGTIIIEVPPPPPPDFLRVLARPRAVLEGLALLAAAGLTSLSRRANAAAAARLLVTVARERFSAALR